MRTLEFAGALALMLSLSLLAACDRTPVRVGGVDGQAGSGGGNGSGSGGAMTGSGGAPSGGSDAAVEAGAEVPGGSGGSGGAVPDAVSDPGGAVPDAADDPGTFVPDAAVDPGGAVPDAPVDRVLPAGCARADTIFMNKCVPCHSTSTAPSFGGFDMEKLGWAQAMIGGLIPDNAPPANTCKGKGFVFLEVGTQPARGLFLDKFNPTPPCGVRMPQVGTITAAEVACIQDWANNIVAGGEGS